MTMSEEFNKKPYPLTRGVLLEKVPKKIKIIVKKHGYWYKEYVNQIFQIRIKENDSLYYIVDGDHDLDADGGYILKTHTKIIA